MTIWQYSIFWLLFIVHGIYNFEFRSTKFQPLDIIIVGVEQQRRQQRGLERRVESSSEILLDSQSPLHTAAAVYSIKVESGWIQDQ